MLLPGLKEPARGSRRAFSRRPSSAALLAGLVLLSLAVQAAFFVAPSRYGLPLDDGWIHATYARNLARYGELALNRGHPSTGTTSFLWTGMLAAGHLLLSDPVWVPTLLNGAAQAWLVVVCFLLVRDATGRRAPAALAAAGCALLGNLVWISLSGMEATLFVAIGLTAVWCFARRRWLAAGVLAGVLVLIRPEGAALALTFAVCRTATWLRRGSSRPSLAEAAKLWAPFAIGGVVYVAINLAISGQVLTATFAGRRLLAGQPAEISFAPCAVARRLGDYVSEWWRYLHRWTFGYALLLWLRAPGAALAGTATGVAGGLAALLGVANLLCRRGAQDAPSPTPALLLWAAFHNAAYVLLLPAHGHAGRYQAINFVLLVVLASTGLWRLTRNRGATRRLAWGALVAALALVLAQAVLWRTIYRNSVNHINHVHVRCGRWIDSHLPDHAVVATYDLGAIAYFAGRRIVDLGGLVDPAMARALFAGNAVPYLCRKGATHLALPQHAPDDLRVARRLGLVPWTAGSPRLLPLERWAIPPERYVLHHPATASAMPQITLYRLRWPSQGGPGPSSPPSSAAPLSGAPDS